MLETVLQYGTGRAAAIGQFAAGKTGTTSNYGDAWFVGWDRKYTVAVWVGYPNKLIPMTTDYDGGPVLGGTFPALIWHDFMISALQIDKARAGSRRCQPPPRTGGTRQHRRPPRPRAPPAPPRAGSTGADATGQDSAVERQRQRRTASRPTAERCGATAQAAAAPHADARHTAPRQRPRRRPTPAPTPRIAGRRRPPASIRRPRHWRREPMRRRRVGVEPARGVSPRRPGRGPRDVAVAGGAEAPGQLDRLGDPDARAHDHRGLAPVAARAGCGSGPCDRLLPFSASSMPSACVSLPGPEQSSRSRARARRSGRGERASARCPHTGSSARISTAAPTPSGSQTALSSAWMP